jgi:hypothetical protein
MAGFPAWFAGEIITADGLNGRNMRLVAQESDLTLTTTSFVASQITWVPEPNAVYAYWLYISYSADTTADLAWEWESESTCGVLLASFTQAYVLGAAAGVDTGASVIMRRPANTTDRLAGGTGVGNFHSAYDQGTFSTNSAPTAQTLYVRQGVASGSTILRGGNQTRLVYQRIA